MQKKNQHQRPQNSEEQAVDSCFLVKNQAVEFSARTPSSPSKQTVEVSYTPIASKTENGEDVYGPRKTEVFSSLRALQDSEQFGVIRKAIDDGRLFSIDYWVTAFADEPNMHMVRPKPGSLAKIAAKYRSPNLPLLSEHSWYSESSHRGLVLELDAPPSPAGGVAMLDAKVSIRDPETARRYMGGMVQAYSAGLISKGMECSECGKKYKTERGFFGSYRSPACEHQVGEKYNGKACEGFMTGVEPIELSIVKRGAVKRARNKSESYSDPNTSTLTEQVGNNEEDPMKDKDQQKTLEQVQAELDSVQAKFSASSTELETVKAELAKAKTELEAANKTAATNFTAARNFSIELLMSLGRMTPAEAKSEENLSLYSEVGLTRAHTIFSRGPKRVDLSDEILSRPSPEPTDTGAKPYVFGQTLDSLQKEGMIPPNKTA